MPFMLTPNILDNLNELSQIGFKFYGASMGGKNIETMEFSAKRVLVMGSESKGISKKVVSKLHQNIAIEMKHGFDSLNVSVASGILIQRMSYAVK
jgi:23S rRNA (guanosine2251-2'-O)-methyltransferase